LLGLPLYGCQLVALLSREHAQSESGLAKFGPVPQPACVAVETQSASDITALLRKVGGGDREALDGLVPLLYEHLRRLAHSQLLKERSDHTLNTTALIHEAYLRLVDIDRARWKDRAHFLAASSQVMRHILVDYARRRNAYKRGGGVVRVELYDDALQLAEEYAEAVIDLHDALERLEAIRPRQSQLLEQRYFGGLELKECAEVLGVSLATVTNELKVARAWLACELNPEFSP